MSAGLTPAGFASDAFAGTAEAYLLNRRPYPGALLEHLLARIAGRERLLDLGCGPGRLTIDLAPRFAQVLAVDIEPEMIAVGRAEAARRALRNIVWSIGAAEALKAPPGALDLVTAAEAFHRFDRPGIARLVLAWLKPGGGLAILGADGAVVGDALWQRAAQDVVRRFSDRPSPSGPGDYSGRAADEALLRDAGFHEVQSFDFEVELDWTANSVLGHLHSTSYCSLAVLGDRAGAFEAELAAALGDCEPSGVFRQSARFGYTFARR
ncbi:MAG TPA: class I SAM-dependent methyltransferase [Caulobacteraceae bacterium]|nr:class I SAM-dependent methyltransferase [Caulobacteraceae bacterium]